MKNYQKKNSLNDDADSQSLRKRKRLYSESVMHPDFEPLQPLRRTNDKSPHLNLQTPNVKKESKNPVFARKNSFQYINEFKQNKEMHNKNNLLNHLANALSRNVDTNNKNKIENYRPEYVVDWKLEKNEITGLEQWRNEGNIELNEELIEECKKMTLKQAINCNKFYKKKIWFYEDIISKNIDTEKDNPILVINRRNILEESYNQFMTTKDLNLRRPIQIHFVDEVAHDTGGVYREWYNCLYKEIFNEKNKLFRENPNKAVKRNTYLIYPFYPGQKLEYFEFFGKLIGKAILDNVNINNYLNRVVVKYLINQKVTLDDIKYYDSELYNSLVSIKNNDVEGTEGLSDIKFVWNLRNADNQLETVELIENGFNINLTNNNKDKFIEKVIYMETYKSYKDQIEAIQKGIFDLIGDTIIKVFNVDEFIIMLTGQLEIDLDDWKNNTIYKGHYNEEHEVIKNFWAVLKSLKQEDLQTFLEFCTGSNHPPIDGFAALKGINHKIQKFTIEPQIPSYLSNDKKKIEFKLIEAKTCFNRILLPEYKNKEEMKKSINIILKTGVGFFGLE